MLLILFTYSSCNPSIYYIQYTIQTLIKGAKTMEEMSTKQLAELVAVLIDKLIADNRMEDVQKATKDQAERDRLLKEYNLI